MTAQTRRRGLPGRPEILFLLRALLYLGIALWLVSRWQWIEAAGIRVTADSVYGALLGLRHEVVRVGSDLVVSGAGVRIVSDCSPHVPFLIYAAVVLAFPATWKQRLIGIVGGAIVIHIFNTIRILALIWTLVAAQGWFEFAHVYLWQTGTVLVVFVTFALWLRLTRARRFQTQ